MVQKLLRKARKGTKVIYVPGNHDEPLRDYTDMQFGGVTILEETIHVTADGRRFLIMHGDKFDGIVKYARWLAILGDQAYNAPARAQPLVQPGAPPASAIPTGRSPPTSSAGSRTPCSYIDDFEVALAEEARRRGVDGVVCGHIHKAEIREIGAHPLLQRRRLGGELHGAGRASRRPARDPGLGEPAQLLDAEPGHATATS